MSTTPLFPMFLKLAGRTCLVVGAGHLGEQKIRGLIDAGAEVRVIAPSATPAIAEASSTGALTWFQRTFEPSDLDGVFLVVAATSSTDVNHAIYQRAQQRGILCNVVDDPPHCDFFYPAVVRRGQFQIAISTGGLSPALAQRVRKQLEDEFPPIYSAWLEFLGRQRTALFHDVADPELRRNLIHQSVTGEAFAQFENEQLRYGGTGVSPVQPGGDARLSTIDAGKELL
jgi:precorrin-2 dehydrogenase/sirohydrochlorin ferrochelatase